MFAAFPQADCRDARHFARCRRRCEPRSSRSTRTVSGRLLAPPASRRSCNCRRRADQLGDHRIVNVNSTATGGGVAEMLATLIGYVRGVGIEAEWLVIAGEPEFFAVTKRIHNGLYGSPGDGGELGQPEREIYEHTAAANVAPICDEIRPVTS